MDFRLSKRTVWLLIYDIFATYTAYFLGSLLTNVLDEVFVNNEIYFIIGILAVINIIVLSSFKLYNNLWEYAGIHEAIQISLAAFLGTFLGAIFLWIIGVRLPIRVFFAAAIILVFLHGGMRMLWRITYKNKGMISRANTKTSRPRTLIVGAGETGALTIGRMLARNPNMPGIPIIATDDDPNKRKLRIHGIRVMGNSEDIPELVQQYDIEQIVVAIPSATAEEQRRIYSICITTDCSLKTLPNIRQLRVDEVGDVSLRDVDVTDLLGREEIKLDTRIASSYISGKTVLVTGGGGSIGSELCRQLSKVAPSQIVIFDMYENDAYMLQQELLRRYSDMNVVVEIGNVCDTERVHEVFETYSPRVVFHAAAHKHVPLMELCPREAVQNNVFGTLNVVREADSHKVDRFIFISTDKAVNPTSVMGATKRMGEMIVQYYAQTSDTIFSAVRFGNVLGSNGSVIPVFKKQIQSGGPITITHPDIERFFMTIPEAVRLVIQAGGMAKGGEIFILDMGEPVRILDLAHNLIRLSGADVRIEFIGLREGEKMFEELLMDEEKTIPTRNKSIMIAIGDEISYDEVAKRIEQLENAVANSGTDMIRCLEDTVESYRYTTHKGESI